MSNNRPTLLLADDDPTIADSLAPFLERAGFHVLVVSDGMHALEKVQAHHPELIILDVLMPRMDGREVLLTLGRLDVNCARPFTGPSGAPRHSCKWNPGFDAQGFICARVPDDPSR